MSETLIDTNVLIDLVFARSEAMSERFSAASRVNEALYLSTISLYEFRFGAERSRRRDFQLEALSRFLAAVTDLLIAAQALDRNLTVATNNLREVTRVEGLVVEDWRAPPP